MHVLHGLRLHVASWAQVLDVRETKGTSAVLVARKLGNSGACIVLIGELDDTSATRATVRLVLYLGTLDLTDRGEQLDQIFVARAPW